MILPDQFWHSAVKYFCIVITNHYSLLSGKIQTLAFKLFGNSTQKGAFLDLAFVLCFKGVRVIYNTVCMLAEKAVSLLLGPLPRLWLLTASSHPPVMSYVVFRTWPGPHAQMSVKIQQ